MAYMYCAHLTRAAASESTPVAAAAEEPGEEGEPSEAADAMAEEEYLAKENSPRRREGIVTRPEERGRDRSLRND